MATRFAELSILQTACLETLTRMRRMKRVVNASILDDSVGRKEAKCSRESFSMMIAATILVGDGIGRV